MSHGGNPEGKYTTFRRYGEIQRITIRGDEVGTLTLDGEEVGTFALDIIEYQGNTTIATTSFEAIPAATTTVATLSVSDSTLENIGALEVDYNGDGEVDTSLTPAEGETVTLPAPTFTELIDVFKQVVVDEVDNKSLKHLLANQADRWQKLYEQTQTMSAKFEEVAEPFSSKLSKHFSFIPSFEPKTHVIQMQLNFAERQLDRYVQFGKLSAETSEKLKEIINLIKESL